MCFQIEPYDVIANWYFEGVSSSQACERDQTLFARGAYTASDNPLRENRVWPRDTSLS